MNKRGPIILLIPIAFAIILMGLLYLALANHWFGQYDGIVEFCEAPVEGLIKEPVNTWSNLGFIIVGIYIAWFLAKGESKNNNSLNSNFFYALFFPCLVVFLGPGSMAKHAAETYAAGFFDMLSMYLIASFISAFAMQRFFGLTFNGFIVIFSIELFTCICAHFVKYEFIFGFFGNTIFAFYLSIGIVFEVLNAKYRKFNADVKWIIYSLASLVISVVIWNLSKTGTSFCYPHSLFQGHAFWHLGTAIALLFLFKYYISEDFIFQNNKSK